MESHRQLFTYYYSFVLRSKFDVQSCNLVASPARSRAPLQSSVHYNRQKLHNESYRHHLKCRLGPFQSYVHPRHLASELQNYSRVLRSPGSNKFQLLQRHQNQHLLHLLHQQCLLTSTPHLHSLDYHQRPPL